jgi:hypothetical protein
MNVIIVSLVDGRQVVTYCQSQREARRYAILWEYRYGIPSWVETI